MRTRRVLQRLILGVAVLGGAYAMHPVRAAADDSFGYLQDLREMEDVINKGTLLFVPHPMGVLPVHVDDYMRKRTFEIFLNAKSSKDVVQQILKLKAEVDQLKRNGRQAIKEMIEETQKKVDEENAEWEARKNKGVHAQASISDEERAESPAAPDAATRTLTVDNKPPPPPDGTPIIEARVPPRHDDGRSDNGDSDNNLAVIQGIIGVAGALSQNGSHNHGGNVGNRGRGQTPSHPNPHPRGC